MREYNVVSSMKYHLKLNHKFQLRQDVRLHNKWCFEFSKYQEREREETFTYKIIR